MKIIIIIVFFIISNQSIRLQTFVFVLNFSIGWIAEKYGYKSSLIVAGIFMGVSGLVTLLIPVIQRLRRNQDDTNNERTTKTSTKTSV